MLGPCVLVTQQQQQQPFYSRTVLSCDSLRCHTRRFAAALERSKPSVGGAGTWIAPTWAEVTAHAFDRVAEYLLAATPTLACRRGRRRRRRHPARRRRCVGSDVELPVSVCVVEVGQRVSPRVRAKCFQDHRTIEGRVALEHQSRTTGDVRAGHGGAAQHLCVLVAVDPDRFDVAPRGPQVDTCPVIGKGRPAVCGVGRPNSDCCSQICRRVPASLIVGIARSSHHRYRSIRRRFNGSLHAFIAAADAQAHAYDSRPGRTCCDPIQCCIGPRNLSTTAVAQHLRAQDRSTWCDSEGIASYSAGAVRAMAPLVTGTAHVTTALM